MDGYLRLAKVEDEQQDRDFSPRRIQFQHNDMEEIAQSRGCGVLRRVVGATGQGYMPLQRGRTPESWLNGGPAGGERNVRALLEKSYR